MFSKFTLRLTMAFFMLCALYSFAQVGINTAKPNDAAMLDIESRDKGILIPRIALRSISDAFPLNASMPESMLIYNTIDAPGLNKGFMYWGGSRWIKLVVNSDLDINNWSRGDANVNSDWTATSGDEQILNKPTKLSDFTNDLDIGDTYLDNAYISNNILVLERAGASPLFINLIPYVNRNADWTATSGDEQILNKPTKLSEFTNDLNLSSDNFYVTSSSVAGKTLSLSRNGGLPTLNSDFSNFWNTSDFTQANIDRWNTAFQPDYLRFKRLGDANAATGTGFRTDWLTGANEPVGTDFALTTLRYDDSPAYAYQTAGDWRTGDMFTRPQTNGTYGSWAKLWSERDFTQSDIDTWSDNFYTTSSTLSNDILTINRNGGLPAITTDFSEYAKKQWTKDNFYEYGEKGLPLPSEDFVVTADGFGGARNFNWNSLGSTGGFYKNMSSTGSTNKPPGGFHYPYQMSYTNNGNITQLAYPYRAGTDGFYIRSRFQGSWSDWFNIWTSSDFTQADINRWNSNESNVNSDWAATSGDAFILNKPTRLSDFTNDLNTDNYNYIRKDINDEFKGQLVANGKRNSGIYGNYNIDLADHIWSMANRFTISEDGTDFGSLYGMAYKYDNRIDGQGYAGGHQIVFANNGIVNAAIGFGGRIWTRREGNSAKWNLAEPNVNSDWLSTSGDSEILNKPTRLSQFTNDLPSVPDVVTTVTDNNNGTFVYRNEENINTTVDTRNHTHDASQTVSGEFNINRIRLINAKDTRNINDAPFANGRGSVAFDFKRRTTINNPFGSSTYSGLMNFSPWGDNSGGPNYQMAYSHTGDDAKLSVRTGFSDGWNQWNNLWTSSDFTQTDINRWNATSTGADNYIRNDINDTFTGQLVANGSRNSGIYGTYNSTLADHIWSMGSAYRIADNGSSFGNLYGMAYKYNNKINGEVNAGLHQIVFTANGDVATAISLNTGRVWTKSDGNSQKWNDADPNVQSDWNTTTTTSDSFIKNKPTRLSQFTNDLVPTTYTFNVKHSTLTLNNGESFTLPSALVKRGPASLTYQLQYLGPAGTQISYNGNIYTNNQFFTIPEGDFDLVFKADNPLRNQLITFSVISSAGVQELDYITVNVGSSGGSPNGPSDPGSAPKPNYSFRTDNIYKRTVNSFGDEEEEEINYYIASGNLTSTTFQSAFIEKIDRRGSTTNNRTYNITSWSDWDDYLVDYSPFNYDNSTNSTYLQAGLKIDETRQSEEASGGGVSGSYVYATYLKITITNTDGESTSYTLIE